MEKFGPVRRGEVYWILTPNRPRDPHQPRLGIVVSDDDRNALFDHALFVPIYHRGTEGPTHLRIQAGVGGVPDNSLIFCEEIATLDYEFVDFESGPLGRPVPPRLLREIAQSVLYAMDVIES